MTDSYIRLLPFSDHLLGISALFYNNRKFYLHLQMKALAGTEQTVQYSTVDLIWATFKVPHAVLMMVMAKFIWPA